MNWKLRLKNKATLTAITLQVISIIYLILTTFNITPSIDQNWIIGLAESIIGLFVLLGVVVDPTTTGVSDSNQAMSYDEPKDDYK